MMGIEPGFGLHSVPVGAKQAPLALNSTLRSGRCQTGATGTWRLHSVSVGVKQVPLALNAPSPAFVVRIFSHNPIDGENRK